MKNRAEIEEKYKWDLSQYVSSLEEWEKRVVECLEKSKSISRFEGKLTNDKNILDCLQEESNLSKELETLGCYIHLRQAENALDSEIEAKQNFFGSVTSKISVMLSFISSSLNALNNGTLSRLASDRRFKNFDILFKEIIRQKKHTLSAKEEKLLSKVGECLGSSSEVFDMFDNADNTFEDVTDSTGMTLTMNYSLYSVYMQSNDRVLRKNTYNSMHNAFKKMNKTLSANYIANVIEDCTFAKIRNYPSSLDATLFSSEISPKVYDTLIRGVTQNLKLFHKYYEVKRQILKLPKFAIYDVYATPNAAPLFSMDYESAFEAVKDACAVLGQEYCEALDMSKNKRWIDVYPNEGKDRGAFSSGAYGKNPVVSMNYTGELNSVFTLAHELGHCMHTYFSNKNQVYEKAGYRIFVAEVASTVNETLLCLKLLEKSKSDEEKICIYDHICSFFHSTVMRQTMFAEFEQFAHEQYEQDKPLSSDILNAQYQKLNEKYFGKDVEIPEVTKFEWSRIPHFYNSFYVYKYATGLISALSLASDIYSNKKDAKEKYLNFLKSGGTLPPVKLLQNAGVDLENVSTFENAFKFVENILCQWQKIYNKNSK